jgi:hypothetical protein
MRCKIAKRKECFHGAFESQDDAKTTAYPQQTAAPSQADQEGVENRVNPIGEREEDRE